MIEGNKSAVSTPRYDAQTKSTKKLNFQSTRLACNGFAYFLLIFKLIPLSTLWEAIKNEGEYFYGLFIQPVFYFLHR